jgi:hypothetical protein
VFTEEFQKSLSEKEKTVNQFTARFDSQMWLLWRNLQMNKKKIMIQNTDTSDSPPNHACYVNGVQETGMKKGLLSYSHKPFNYINWEVPRA